MSDAMIAVALGAASGVLGTVAFRFRMAWMGWLALTPLTVAVYLYSPLAAGLAGAACALLLTIPNRLAAIPPLIPGARWIEIATLLVMATLWGVVFGAAGWLWPHGAPAWGVLIMPASAFILGFGFGIFEPRYMSWFLAAQATAPSVVHVARLGGELSIATLLALSATVPVMLLAQLPPSLPSVAVSVLAIVIVMAALGLGWASYRRALVRDREIPCASVAVVAVAPEENDYSSPAYHDIDGLIARYEPRIAQAAAQKAQLIVLPEKTAVVTNQTRERWLAAVSCWARDSTARVVAGLFDEDREQNQLVIAKPSGEIAVTYDKQHPARIFGRGEPKPPRRTLPALDQSGPFPVSGMICVDGDYSDMVPPVARAGGVLALPTNDWDAIFESHLRAATWLAVRAGVPLVRSNGHGISAVFDAAGRILAEADSREGPVVLVADVHPAKPLRVQLFGNNHHH